MRTYATPVAFCAVTIASFSTAQYLSPVAREAAKLFRPHGAICLNGDPLMIIFYEFGNLMVFLAYTAIPVTLVLFAMLLREFPGQVTSYIILKCVMQFWVLFSAFIFFCGAGHLWEIMSLTNPDWYWFTGAWTFFGTGPISIMTAGAFASAYRQAKRTAEQHHESAFRPIPLSR